MAKKPETTQLPLDVNPNYQRNEEPANGVPPASRAEGAPRTRLVNRNAHIKAASRIVDILRDIDPAKVAAILRTVQDALAEQPLLPFIASENQ